MNNRTDPAIITATLALGASISAPYYDINITQRLCSAACADETPVFSPQFSVKSIANVGTSQYLVVIHAEGVISYVPSGGATCCTRSQLISQDFAVPVFSTAAISSVTPTAGTAHNGIVRLSCCGSSRTFVSDVPLTLTITAATA